MSTIDPHRLLSVGRLLEQQGCALAAVLAYREVILAGESLTTAEARRRLRSIVARATPGRPV